MTAKKRKLEAVPEPRIAKGPTTKSGTLSAADRKPATAKAEVAALVEDAKARIADASDGPGLVEHGAGLGRHRPEDGPTPAEGTVILVTPERGA